ncbi:MAG: hypothetical protein JST66_00485 [Bacteroidetes bacterium]|nr:hypothetical protein [Bacteroidota bacterium]
MSEAASTPDTGTTDIAVAIDPPLAAAVPEAAAAPSDPSASPMDVHYHTHQHGRKTWKAYVFEFFMLFLAVFCGFLAEWQLEHTVEHQHEEKFMHGMVNDLRADIDQSAQLMVELEGKLAALDTLVDLLADTAVANDSRRAAQLWFHTAGFTDFVYTDGTMQQLKSSGALRLVRKAGVADSIMAYDRGVRTLLIHQQMLNDLATRDMDVFHLFDYRALRLRPDAQVPLLRNTPADLSAAYADRALWRAQFIYLKARLVWIQQAGARLRAYIAEQYGFKG